ncbi:MAG TPA: 16S rRNA (cytidine(1402)-2'-O)-methyltransferase [Anaerolineae bacterium]|nr:16S rRNA (cytidine(1402)-2'-O)-methyltransferase [Anaerolineae bacterium]
MPFLTLCYNYAVGTLYLVATPIGNLEDLTQRALRILREVDLIAAEDTRQTRKLLNHFQIDTPLISYHEHNKLKRLERLRQALEEGDLALVSDAGTPGLSDPGYLLVRYALDAGCPVSPIPGPSAPIAALVASGLPTDSFVFLGYLPRRRLERLRLLQEISGERRTMLAFEVPHRLLRSLEDLETTFGGQRPIVVCRELTKMHEEILRDTLSAIREHFAEVEPRGEFTLVIGGVTAGERWDEAAVRRALDERIARGLNPSEAAREVAAQAGWPRREVYRLTLEDT